MSLMKKLQKTTKIADSSVLSTSHLFKEKDVIVTDVPIINVALSGSLRGGLRPGVLSIAGKSRHFKTSYALLIASAYLKKFPEAILLFYDSEFGASEKSFEAFGIDPTRVLHVPITNIEELKFDLMSKLDNKNADGIKRGDKVIILIDSIGNLASVKEANDAVSENSAQDMSRPKMLKQFWRLVTPHLTLKNIPLIAIQHTYDGQQMYAPTVMSGGQGGLLASDNVWFIGRSQEKDGTDLLGYTFTITIEKSRYVKEKSKLPVTVTFDGGISKYTGILDLALEAGEVVKPNNGWYQLVDKETGELLGSKVRSSQTETDEFLGVVLARESFNKWVEDNYMLSVSKILADQENKLTDEEDNPLEAIQ